MLITWKYPICVNHPIQNHHKLVHFLILCYDRCTSNYEPQITLVNNFPSYIRDFKKSIIYNHDGYTFNQRFRIRALDMEKILLRASPQNKPLFLIEASI